MSCPTCSGTMQLLTIGREATFYNCPRCGTIRRVAGDSTEDTVPKLVERCREFEKSFPPGNPPAVSFSQEWHRLGIAESIHPEALTGKGE